MRGETLASGSEAGCVTAQSDAALVLQLARPDASLVGLCAEDHDALFAQTKALLAASRRALRDGTLTLDIPPALGGGRLGWRARSGAVRELITLRLGHLVHSGVLAERDRSALVYRFGLHGYPGGADEAQRSLQLQRQATTNAVNRATKVLAADLAAQPLLPVDTPTVSQAQREEIVGCVLSTMAGPPEEAELRQYVHARVRRVLLGDPVHEGAFQSAKERQRAHRTAMQWLAIASDHLDRRRLPWDSLPNPSEEDEEEASTWLEAPADVNMPSLSVGGIRGLTRRVESLTRDRGRPDLLALLADGYRPMIELTQVARWAMEAGNYALRHDPPERRRAKVLLWVGVLLALADVTAHRGYHQLAHAYLGRANQVIATAGSLTDEQRAHARLRAGLTHAATAFLKGPQHLRETRQWHGRLIADLQGMKPIPEYVIAVAQSMIRTEHSAVYARVGEGQPVGHILAPLEDLLDEVIPQTYSENRARLAISISHYAALVGDTAAMQRYRILAPANPAETSPKRPTTNYDEWYCASSAANARWGRGQPPAQGNSWRR